MGLRENEVFPPPPLPPHASAKGVMRSSGSSPVFFSSVSSVDSTNRRPGSIESGESPSAQYGNPRPNRTCGGCYNMTLTPAPAPPTLNSNPYLTAPLYNSSGGGSSLVVQPGEPSIVERNARVIKWLFNCRKAVEISKENNS
jgi:hypothetical protein